MDPLLAAAILFLPVVGAVSAIVHMIARKAKGLSAGSTDRPAVDPRPGSAMKNERGDEP